MASNVDRRGPAEWTRVDLHMHSPAVATFAWPSGLGQEADADRAADLWVEALVDAGIGLAALTDYNHLHEDWYERLSSRATEAGIPLLPGAELSLAVGRNAIHVLLVADATVSPANLNQVIASIDRGTTPLVDGSDFRAIELHGGLAEVANQIRASLPGALLIPAHPCSSNGFLKALAASRALRFLEDLGADAIEHLREADASKLRSVDAIRAGYYTARLVEFSDPRQIPDIGARSLADGSPRATWLRLSDRSATGVRTALQDPGTRLRTGARPDVPRHPRCERLRVQGVGFLSDLDIQFSPHLTTAIGGRGVGKSALLQVLRYALDLPTYREGSVEADVVRHALGSGGQVEVDVVLPEPAGRRYTVSRILGETPVVRESGGAVTDLAPGDVFGDRAAPIVLAQRELQFIAEEQTARRRLLDELIGNRALAADARFRSAVAELRENAAAVEALDAKLGSNEEISQQLRQVRHRLSVLEEHGGAEQLAEQRQLRQRHEALQRTAQLASDLERDVTARARATREDMGVVVDAWPSGGDSELDERRAELAASIERLDRALDEAVAAAEVALRAATAAMNLSSDQVATAAEALAGLKQKLATEDLDPDLLLDLDRERSGLQAQQDEQERLATRREEYMGERRRLLERQRACRREAFLLRQEEAAAVSRRLSGAVEIDIVDRGDKPSFRARLTALLKGSGVSTAAVECLAENYLDGPQLVEAAMEDWEALGVSANMSRRLSNWLAEEGRYYELQLVVPEDHVEIRLSVDGTSRPLEQLSLGQRATALLLLLFATDQRPLVLDQPEDDLDNRFVYDDVVPLLRRAKGGDEDVLERQVVTATHNANIPVLGDAEQILVLDVVDHRGHVVCDGSIDRQVVREAVRTILEGGEEAFTRRLEKYGMGARG